MFNLAGCVRWQCAFALLVLLFVSVLPIAAQDATGRIIGIVTDPTGAVVPRAKVTVTNVATGAKSETTSGEDGSYQVLLLPIGAYTVAAEAQGFRRIVTGNQQLEINQSLKVDLKLEVGATTETVQVEANASGVETVNSTLGASVTTSQIVKAPLNGRNVMDLATLLPGVIPGVAGTSTTAGGTSFSIAGASGRSRSQRLAAALWAALSPCHGLLLGQMAAARRSGCAGCPARL